VRSRRARHEAYLVTEARQPRAAEISQRERRYLVMMGIRVLCFVVTVIMFVNHAGWLTVIPAVGAIALPYFAVVVANTRRPGGSDGFRPYQPRLPERYVPPEGSASRSGSTDGGSTDGGSTAG
jgi:hypothetical protein